MHDRVLGLFIGVPKPLVNDSSVISAMEKSSVEEIIVSTQAIIGDEVCNTVHHGGNNRVIHHFPMHNYEIITNYYPQLKNIIGTMGENILSDMLTDESVCIGDVYKIGEVEVLVTEPRKPCRTINHKYKVTGLARFIQEKAITGWFYRVLVPGKIKKGDSIELIKRSYPEITIKFCVDALLNNYNREHLKKMVSCEELSMNWKRPALEIIQTGIIPDDKNRLGDN